MNKRLTRKEIKDLEPSAQKFNPAKFIITSPIIFVPTSWFKNSEIKVVNNEGRKKRIEELKNVVLDHGKMRKIISPQAVCPKSLTALLCAIGREKKVFIKWWVVNGKER